MLGQCCILECYTLGLAFDVLRRFDEQMNAIGRDQTEKGQPVEGIVEAGVGKRGRHRQNAGTQVALNHVHQALTIISFVCHFLSIKAFAG